MKRETVIVLDFGGQYNQLIARRVRECNVYCEIYSYKTDIEKIKEIQPKGIIFTGGPNSVYLEDSPTYTKEIFELGIPVLGICYGAQLMMHLLGGQVGTAPVREYGKIEVTVEQSSKIFENVSEKTICWMSHNDYIAKEAPGFEIIAHTSDCPVAAVQNPGKNLYAVQFHPEVLHTQEGKKMLYETLLLVETPTLDGTFPSDAENLDNMNYLAGKSLDWVNKMACQGTLEAHEVTGNVPNLIITMPDMREETFGYMCYFFFKACAVSVYLLNVNPFNQPGVEVYKKNMFRLLGKN